MHPPHPVRAPPSQLQLSDSNLILTLGQMNEALIADPVRSRQILERIPAGRWGTPSDFEGAVVFLASRASDYVSGECLVVDGGWMGSEWARRGAALCLGPRTTMRC